MKRLCSGSAILDTEPKHEQSSQTKSNDEIILDGLHKSELSHQKGSSKQPQVPGFPGAQLLCPVQTQDSDQESAPVAGWANHGQLASADMSHIHFGNQLAIDWKPNSVNQASL